MIGGVEFILYDYTWVLKEFEVSHPSVDIEPILIFLVQVQYRNVSYLYWKNRLFAYCDDLYKFHENIEHCVNCVLVFIDWYISTHGG